MTDIDRAIPLEQARKIRARSRAKKLNGRRHALTDVKPAAALILDPRAPLTTARSFVESRYTRGDDRELHYHNGAFHAWTGTHYPEADESTLRSHLYDFLDAARRKASNGKLAPFNPNRSKVGDIVDALMALTNLPATIRPPAWLTHVADIPADEIIACQNGLLHMPTRELLPHTPAFFTPNALEFAFNPRAAASNHWQPFLESIWPDDAQSIETLQEIVGYFLTQDTRQQKLVLVVGPKRSGKGAIARAVTRVVGRDNVVGPTLASLADHFGLAPLIGKRLAIISDARLGSRADQHAIAERLLAISGEDSHTIDRKHRVAWTGRLQTRFMILSNELPSLADASGALASRFIVLVMTKSFYGQEDHGLEAKIESELPGILNWALDGWTRLVRRGYFVQPESSREAVQELEDLGSPINAFLRQRCELSPARQVVIDHLFNAWSDWCKANGRDHPGTSAIFGKNLRAAFPELTITQPRDGDSRSRVYEGIGLK